MADVSTVQSAATECHMSDPIAYVEFVDRKARPVFEDARGQYVVADNGEPLYGTWYIPPEDDVLPRGIEANE